jgi:hypothetical protein
MPHHKPVWQTLFHLKISLAQEEISQHWKSAVLAAKQTSEKNRGELPTNILREFEASLEPQLDWRILLSRFLIQTPTDFQVWTDASFIADSIWKHLSKTQCISMWPLIHLDPLVEKS